MSAAMILSTVLLSAPGCGPPGCMIAEPPNVSLENMNLNLGYTDVAGTGGTQGLDQSIERIYNSKAVFAGMFGLGWGTEFESYIEPPASDGILDLHEFGGGAEIMFTPDGRVAGAETILVEQLVRAGRRLGRFTGNLDLAAYRNKLEIEAYTRMDTAMGLQRARLLEAPAVPIGMVARSTRFAVATLTRLSEGYSWEGHFGNTRSFDNDGKLTALADRTGRFTRLFRDSEGRIRKIVASHGPWLQFYYDTEDPARVALVRTSWGAQAVYRYKNTDLVYSKDVDGNEYTYGYDERHNLTSIGYADGSSLKVTYQTDDVSGLTRRDGTTWTLGYSVDRNPNGSRRVVRATVATRWVGEHASIFEFNYGRDSAGNERLDNQKTYVDGALLMDADLVPRADGRLRWRYYDRDAWLTTDAQGNIVREVDADETITRGFHRRTNSLSYVSREPRRGPVRRFDFEWSASSRLISVREASGARLEISYQDSGLIDRVLDGQSRAAVVQYERTFAPDGSQKTVRLSSAGAAWEIDLEGHFPRIKSVRGNADTMIDRLDQLYTAYYEAGFGLDALRGSISVSDERFRCNTCRITKAGTSFAYARASLRATLLAGLGRYDEALRVMAPFELRRGEAGAAHFVGANILAQMAVQATAPDQARIAARILDHLERALSTLWSSEYAVRVWWAPNKIEALREHPRWKKIVAQP